MVSAAMVDEDTGSMTVRIEALSSRWRTRVIRQRTVEPTLGSEVFMFVLVEWRGIEIVGLQDLFCAGVVVEVPIIEAMMLDS
jgi:hypothetical protein